MLQAILAGLFGGGRNLVRDTAEVFVENSEARGGRRAAQEAQVLAQYAAEFARPPSGGFDRLVDGLNRLPRPGLALGTLGLFVAAMVDPVWFSLRMSGLALVPEPLWWLLGVIVTFYFGARHQVKAQEFTRGLAAGTAAVPQVLAQRAALAALAEAQAAVGTADPDGDAGLSLAAGAPEANPALAEWRLRADRFGPVPAGQA